MTSYINIKRSINDISLVWKVVGAVAVTTIITVSVAGWFSFRAAEEKLLVAAMAEMNESMERQVSRIKEIQFDAERDVRIISMMDAVQGYGRAYRNNGFDPLENVFLDDHLAIMEKSFSALLNSKQYLQVRLIGFDNEGMELVRLDAPEVPDGKPIVVSGQDLQHKGSSRYTAAGFSLSRGGIYISPLDLNREHGFIQMPYLPTQRFVAPIYLQDGENEESLFGIVVINIDASSITGSLEANSNFEVMMTNSTGGILAHPNPDECWGFEFGRNETLEKLHPDAWKALRGYRIENEDAMDEIHLTASISIDKERGDFLGLVLTAQKQDVLAGVSSYKQRAALSVTLAIILAVSISGMLIAWLIKPISLLTKQAVLLASGEKDITLEVQGNDEVGRLGKAFKNLISQLQEQKNEADLRSVEVKELNDSLEDKVDQRTRELVSTQDKMKKDAATRQALNQMMQASLKATSAEELLDSALGLLLDTDFLAIENQAAAFQTEKNGSVLAMKAHRNLAGPLKQICDRVPFGKCLCGQAAQKGEIIFKFSDDAMHHISFDGMPPHGHYNVPLMSGENVLGMLALYVPYGAREKDKDRSFLSAVADILAGALKRLNAEEATAASARASELALENEMAIKKHLEVAMSDLGDAKNAAESANESKSAFLANMSHEIRTPMTAILGYTDLLGEPDVAESERAGYLNTIKQNGSHLLTIINDILDISKIESGKMEIETMPISVWQIVDDVIGLMNVRAEERGIDLVSEFSYPLPATIKGDPVRMRQILVNLVGNAIKFTAKGAVKIKISLVSNDAGDKKMIQMAVEDSGIGMTEEQMSKLFTPFTQADASTTRIFGGTGLGLTISKRLSEMMGGDISLASEEGKGSIFTVSLPCSSATKGNLIDARPEMLLEKGPSASRADSGDLHKARILLAEDTIVNQKLAVRLLAKAGHEVETADNGKIAMEMALAAWISPEPYDLILMDMLMPVMDGYEATSALREAGYDLPIVALTAAAMAGDRDKCLAAGCDDFATKPFKRVKLLATIQQWVDKVSVSV